MNILLKNEKKIFQCYREYLNVFPKNKINELFVHIPQDHVINIEKFFFFENLYNLSQTGLLTLRDYLKKHLKKEFIISSILSVEVFVIFVKKNDELLLCVNYQKFDIITRKNQHSLPLVEKTLNRLIDVKKYIKLNIQHAYNLIQIKPGDE